MKVASEEDDGSVFGIKGLLDGSDSVVDDDFSEFGVDLETMVVDGEGCEVVTLENGPDVVTFDVNVIVLPATVVVVMVSVGGSVVDALGGIVLFEV